MCSLRKFSKKRMAAKYSLALLDCQEIFRGYDQRSSLYISRVTHRHDDHYGRSRSMTTVTFSVPGLIGRLIPSRSPLSGMAFPDFDERATMTTVSMSESFLDGMGLVESSSRKVKGKSFFDARTIDTGIGGPATSFAN